VLVPTARRRQRPLTIVCHLMADAAAEGRIVGHVDVVNTGDAVAIKSIEDLIALVERFGLLELSD
jgi:hypothetical protein